jgi:hypothetical protein
MLHRLAQTMALMLRRVQQQPVREGARQAIGGKQALLQCSMQALGSSRAPLAARMKRLESALLQQVSMETLQGGGFCM